MKKLNSLLKIIVKKMDTNNEIENDLRFLNSVFIVSLKKVIL